MLSLPAHTINIGILAHVDAGKTSLTERLLFARGATSRLGSVDGGDSQTDSGELERRRGITIRSAVAAFALDDLQVNLVDTPGHPDFIAEVERALSVLDGAVLVISAVEGVQAQTRVLMRSLIRLKLPVLIFVNKVDQTGADYGQVLDEIRRKLTPDIVAMVRVSEEATWAADVSPRSLADEDFSREVAEVLASHDESLFQRLVEEAMPSRVELRRGLVDQVRDGLNYPVYAGSAMSGAGTEPFLEGVAKFFPRNRSMPDGELRGTVFAVDRTDKGDKVAYVRLFSGELRERQRTTFRRRGTGGVVEEYNARASGLEVVGPGGEGSGAGNRPGPLTPGNIARIRGLPLVRVGDQLGSSDGSRAPVHFQPPILESIVRSKAPGLEMKLHAALAVLADEDPLIRTRTVGNGATSVLLYGMVQREVIEDRLAREFGVDATFERAQAVYFERPVGTGNALVRFEPRGPNEFWQTVGIRITPAVPGSGSRFTRDVESGLLPRAYHQALEDAAVGTLRQGLHGWEVTDCAVTLTEVGCEAPMTAAGDFRNLTPMVVMRALEQAGTAVYEPGYAVDLEIPGDALRGVIGFLMSTGSDLTHTRETGPAWTVSAEIPAKLLQDLALALPRLSHGEGTISYETGRDRRVRGEIPTRQRFDGNPLDHDEYMRFLSNPKPGSAQAPRQS